MKIIEKAGQYYFRCPGCKTLHVFNNTWDFNKDFSNPTISPSLLITAGKHINYKCHSFIKGGKIQYLSDCTHELKGQTIELPEVTESDF